MKIENLKDLEALLKLMRKQGVEECTVDGIAIKLGEAPAKATTRDMTADTDTLTSAAQYNEEDLLFWSTQVNG